MPFQTKGHFPHFEDVFLDRACRGFEKRAKAIRSHGTLGWMRNDPGEPAWLAVRFSSTGAASVSLHVEPGNRAHLYLTSGGARDRGKSMLRLEGLRLVDNPTLLVETFEWTIDAVRGLGRGEGPDERAVIQRRWEEISLRVVP